MEPTPPAPPAPPTPPAPPAPPAGYVPETRLRGLISEKTKLENDLAAALAKIEDAETAKLGELDKVNRKAAKLEEDLGAKDKVIAAQTATIARGALAVHLSDAHDPAKVAALVPPELVDVENGTLTEAAIAGLKEWRKGMSWAFKPEGPPGNVPGPGGPVGKSAAERYQEAIEKGDAVAAEAAMRELQK